jgi:hypothetical protein
MVVNITLLRYMLIIRPFDWLVLRGKSTDLRNVLSLRQNWGWMVVKDTHGTVVRVSILHVCNIEKRNKIKIWLNQLE